MTAIYCVLTHGIRPEEYPTETYGVPYGWTTEAPPTDAPYMWKDGTWVTDFTKEDEVNYVITYSVDIEPAKRAIALIESGEISEEDVSVLDKYVKSFVNPVPNSVDTVQHFFM